MWLLKPPVPVVRCSRSKGVEPTESGLKVGTATVVYCRLGGCRRQHDSFVGVAALSICTAFAGATERVHLSRIADLPSCSESDKLFKADRLIFGCSSIAAPLEVHLSASISVVVAMVGFCNCFSASSTKYDSTVTRTPEPHAAFQDVQLMHRDQVSRQPVTTPELGDGHNWTGHSMSTTRHSCSISLLCRSWPRLTASQRYGGRSVPGVSVAPCRLHNKQKPTHRRRQPASTQKLI